MSDHWEKRLQNSLRFAGYFSQATPPTSAQIPAGFWGWWLDTTITQLFAVRNEAGTMKMVEATDV